MLMDPNERAVDKDIFEIRIVAERLENPLPDALLHPAPEARIDGEPLAEPFRQIAPRRARARNPKNASTKSRLSRPLLPGSPTLPDSSGAIRSHWASLNINRIKASQKYLKF